jgi:hypothetical protein
VIPLFLLLAPMEFLSFTPRVAAYYLLYGITLSAILMELIFFDFQKAPFTCARVPNKLNLTFLAVIYVFGFTLYSRTMAALEEQLASSIGAALLFFATAALFIGVLVHYRNRRLAAAPALIYEEPADPVVRTLGLSAE